MLVFWKILHDPYVSMKFYYILLPTLLPKTSPLPARTILNYQIKHLVDFWPMSSPNTPENTRKSTDFLVFRGYKMKK